MSYDFSDTSEQRRSTMRKIESRDTVPEQRARAALEELGVGFNEQPRFGLYRPDFELEDGTVLQIMGCFWHCCPCVSHSMEDVEAHGDYWSEKHTKNYERDRRRRRELLTEHGVPFVFWVWEHDDVAGRVAELCEARGLA